MNAMSGEPQRQPASQRQLRNFTRLEYDKLVDAGILGEDEHVELIDGLIVAMSPEGAQHAGVITLAAHVISPAFGDEYSVRVRHPLIIDPDGEPEPDLAVVRGEPRAHLDEHPRDPVLVIEVAESSLAYDRREKARLYARAGFPEYWIINLVAGCLEVHRGPAPGGYQSVVSLPKGAAVSPTALTAVTIAVADLLP
jgi:Uma2 family endonuclease